MKTKTVRLTEDECGCIIAWYDESLSRAEDELEGQKKKCCKTAYNKITKTYFSFLKEKYPYLNKIRRAGKSN